MINFLTHLITVQDYFEHHHMESDTTELTRLFVNYAYALQQTKIIANNNSFRYATPQFYANGVGISSEIIEQWEDCIEVI